MQRNLIAILRGVRPAEVEAVAEAIVDAGISAVEVPLNSPDALMSIQRLVRRFGAHTTIGAGTVLAPQQARAVADVGGRIIVAPDFNPAVVEAALECGLAVWPGVFTATEALGALAANATGLKLFPASILGVEGARALKVILPEGAQVYAVGGAGPADFAAWLDAGVTGFGIGSALYRPGDAPAAVAARAVAIVSAFDAAKGR